MYQRIVYDLSLYKTKLAIKMAEFTFKALLFACIYYPLYVLGMALTAKDIQYWILTGFLVITGAIRFYRWMKRDDQNRLLKDIEIREREVAIREKELEQIEMENFIIKQLKVK